MQIDQNWYHVKSEGQKNPKISTLWVLLCCDLVTLFVIIKEISTYSHFLHLNLVNFISQINPNPKPAVTTPKWPTVTPKPKLKEVTNTPKNTRKTPPLCPCGRRAKRLYVQKHGPNHGRIFFTCTMKSINGKGCSFFQWDTSSDIGQSPAFRPPVKRSWICVNLVVYLPWWAFLQNIFIYVYSKQVLHKKVNTILFGHLYSCGT